MSRIDYLICKNGFFDFLTGDYVPNKLGCGKGIGDANFIYGILYGTGHGVRIFSKSAYTMNFELSRIEYCREGYGAGADPIKNFSLGRGKINLNDSGLEEHKVGGYEQDRLLVL